MAMAIVAMKSFLIDGILFLRCKIRHKTLIGHHRVSPIVYEKQQMGLSTHNLKEHGVAHAPFVLGW